MSTAPFYSRRDLIRAIVGCGALCCFAAGILSFIVLIAAQSKFSALELLQIYSDRDLAWLQAFPGAFFTLSAAITMVDVFKNQQNKLLHCVVVMTWVTIPAYWFIEWRRMLRRDTASPVEIAA